MSNETKTTSVEEKIDRSKCPMRHENGKKYTAEYSKSGQYGTSICSAETIEELLGVLTDRGYTFGPIEKQKILNWSKTDKKKYYGANLSIRCGELKMTEYTSL